MATFIAEPTVPRPARAVDSATNVNARMDTRNLAVTFPRVVRSEWVKFRSLQTTWITMLSAVVMMIGIGALSAAILSGTIGGGGEDGWSDTTDPTTTSLSGMMLAQIIVGIVGVLAITSEFANGMIRATFAAVPKRLPVLWAKVVVVAGVTFAVMLPTMFASFFIGQAFMGSDGASLTDPGVLRAVIGSAGYLTAIALLGLGLGAILRQAAGAIGTVFALLLIAPGILGLVLPASLGDTVLPYLPSNAGQAFSAVGAADGLLAPAVGGLVVLGWIAAVLGVAAVLLKRRDA